MIIEKLTGRWWLGAILVVSALCGSLMSLAINSANTVSVGASGAIMGLLASAFIISWRLPFHAGRTKMQAQLLQILVPSLLPIANYIPGQRVDYGAHVGGLLGGFVMGWLVRKLWPRDSPTPNGRALAVFISCVGLFAFSFEFCMVTQDSLLGMR
jgi:rhomboid protease GluP